MRLPLPGSTFGESNLKSLRIPRRLDRSSMNTLCVEVEQPILHKFAMPYMCWHSGTHTSSAQIRDILLSGLLVAELRLS